MNRCMEWFEKKETEKIVGSVGAGNEGGAGILQKLRVARASDSSCSEEDLKIMICIAAG